ncbi:MAG: DUF1294 domain-containing protein [Clostridia bacterium]|nr:DUF1294 domain-containing protein [Clostridia bacterium]
MLLLLWGIWLVINLITFILYGVDKHKAKRGAWRIPEKTLLTGTWLLGGVGAWLAMRAFRHKTKHLAFQISAPAGAALSLAVMALASAKLLNLF